MSMHPGDEYDRDILDIIPERFEVDPDTRRDYGSGRLRTYLTLGVAVLAVGGIVAAGLHFLGGRGHGGDGVPVVKADERPIKIRPDDRGGMQVPNQDKLVYERMDASEGDAKVERLLPPPETPQVPVKGAQQPDPNLRPQPTPEILKPGTPAIPPPRIAESTQARPAEPPLPKAAAQVPVTSQSVEQASPATASAAPTALAPAARTTHGYAPVENRDTPQSAAQAPAATPPAHKPAQLAAVPAAPAASSAKQKTMAAPAAPVPAPAPAAPMPAVAAPVVKAPASGDWLIQLGALRSAPDAEKEWGRIQRANHDLLGTLKSDVVKVELGEKGTFWRLRAGPLSEQAARQLCTSLKTRNQGCLVARK